MIFPFGSNVIIDIHLYKLVIWLVLDLLEIIQCSAIIQTI